MIVSIVLVLVIGGVIAWFTIIEKITSPEESSLAVKSLIKTEQLAAITLPDRKNELLSALNITKQNVSEGLTHIYALTEGVDGQSVASADEVLVVLDWSMPGTLTRSITDLDFGARRGTQITPYIILKTNNFESAFAGMVEWEVSISKDLTPFFGPVVDKSLKLETGDSKQIVAAKFVDTHVNNRRIRILYDETGLERIVYGIHNQNTIIITTNQTDWIELVNRL